MIISNAQGLKDLSMLVEIGQHLMQKHQDVDFEHAAANYLTTLMKVHSGFKEPPVIKEIKTVELGFQYSAPYISCYVEQVGGIFNTYWIYVGNSEVQISRG